MEPAQSQRDYFENINGLRFLGAVAILFFHCATLPGDIWTSFSDGFWFQKVHFVISRGHLGIVMFFVLSGFLITHILLWEFKSNGKINTINFFIRRFLRVWPLYFLLVIFGFFIFPLLPHGVETVHKIWRFALFLPNLDEIIMGPYDSINFLSTTWSIGVEEQFYIVWGLVLTALTFRKRLNRKVFVGICIGAILSALLFRFFHLDDPRVLYYHTFSVMSDLAIGCLIAIWSYSGGAKRYFENLKRWKIVLFYIAAIAMLLYEGHIFRGTLFVFERITPALIFAVVILEQVYSKQSFFKLDRIPLFFFSGEITYSFYILHSIFIYYWAIFFKEHGYTSELIHYVSFYGAVFASTYATSLITYFTIERPIFRLRKHFR